MQGVEALASSSVVPGMQRNREHEPKETAGTNAPASHATQGVAELESWSVKPAGQIEQTPVEPSGAYVPTGQAIHGVDALRSSSVLPAMHRAHTPEEPAAV
jgi:hypothetical protein